MLVHHAHANDPSEGWLSYAVFRAPAPNDTITKLSATMVVPPKPRLPGGSPAFWFGVQTARGDGALVQPIMAKWLGDGYYMFQEVFDWTDGNDVQSTHIRVQPGETLHAEIEFEERSRSYAMSMTSSTSGHKSTYSYSLLPQQRATESVAYFVLEHQPTFCTELPPSNSVRWTDVAVEVNGSPVRAAKFMDQEEEPKCGAKAVVVNATTIDIVWKA